MKCVFLTGASSGFGSVLASLLLSKGYYVILHYFQHREKVLEIHRKYPDHSMILQGDLTKEEVAFYFKEKLKALHLSVDILIYNAAIDHVSEWNEKNESTFFKVFQLNTLGAYYMIKYFGEEIEEHQGAILSISSDNAIDKYDVVTLEYDISKAGLNIMTKSFADYFKQARVNAICFGWLDTPMNDIPDSIKKSMDFVPLSLAAEKVLQMIESDKTGQIEIVR